MNQQPPEDLHEALQSLTLEQLEQALHCLYREEAPQNPVLQDLPARQWVLLSQLLVLLLEEKRQSSLH